MACFEVAALLDPAGFSRGTTGASSKSLPERSSDPSLSLQGFPFVAALDASFFGLKWSFDCFIDFFPSAISSNSSFTSFLAFFFLVGFSLFCSYNFSRFNFQLFSNPRNDSYARCRWECFNLHHTFLSFAFLGSTFTSTPSPTSQVGRIFGYFLCFYFIQLHHELVEIC